MKVQKKERLVWLDWMKVWAILSIIWGHFFSTGHVYLYVFSVQVFCVISGFLYKKAPDWRSCLQKCFILNKIRLIFLADIRPDIQKKDRRCYGFYAACRSGRRASDKHVE